MTSFSKPSAILLDIEGTTTELSWVSKTLFPFIKNQTANYFEDTFNRAETQELIKRLRAAEENDKSSKDLPKIASSSGSKDAILKSVVKYVTAMTDKKIRPSELKQMQILVWSWGYEKAMLKGHVYDDVTQALHVWKFHHKIDLYVFSSGMVAAQKLLLCCTNHGNLLPLINGFFDSSVGDKIDPDAFTRIAEKIDDSTDRILFITDSPDEAKAAIKANCKAVIISRTGRKIKGLAECNLKVINSFEEIEFKK